MPRIFILFSLVINIDFVFCNQVVFNSCCHQVYHSNFTPLEWTVPHHSATACYAKLIVVPSLNVSRPEIFGNSKMTFINFNSTVRLSFLWYVFCCKRHSFCLCRNKNVSPPAGLDLLLVHAVSTTILYNTACEIWIAWSWVFIASHSAFQGQGVDNLTTRASFGQLHQAWFWF